MKRGRRCAALCAVAVGLLLVPATNASAASRASAREQAQNHRISQVINATRQISVKIGALTGTQRTLGETVASHTNTLKDLQTLTGNIDTRLKAIEAAAPQIISALTQLSAGLTKLGDAYQAVEYGATRIFVGPGGAGGQLPFTATSPDIPDDANTATAAGTLPVSVGPGPGQVPEDVLLAPRSAIRSNEADGAASGDPAGYVGGLVTMQCGGGPGPGGSCDTDPGAGTTPVPAGAVLCVVGPAPTQSINIPGQGPSPFAVVTVQQKASRIDQSKPDASSPNPVAGASAGAGTVVGPLSDDAGDGCKTGETGNTLLLTVQTQYVDIPTSTTPGPKD